MMLSWAHVCCSASKSTANVLSALANKAIAQWFGLLLDPEPLQLTCPQIQSSIFARSTTVGCLYDSEPLGVEDSGNNLVKEMPRSSRLQGTFEKGKVLLPYLWNSYEVVEILTRFAVRYFPHGRPAYHDL